MTVQLKRGTAADWTSANPTLAAGQPGYETDTGDMKIGDGVTAWASLGYFSSGGGGGGTVTSVAMTAPTGFSVTGSPVTTSGTLALTTTLNGYVKGNGSGFTASATIPTGDITGLAAIATSGSATDLSTGTVAAGRMPALTGDVTSTIGTVSTTIANSAVTLAKMADVATSTVFYRKTAGTGAPEVQTLATLKTDLGLTGTNSGDQTITLTGDVTGSGTGSFAATIANDAVTFAKMQNSSAASVLVGRGAGSGAGDLQEITLGTNLSMSGTTLNASGGSGSGDFVGPASSTDNAVVRFDGTTGKLGQDSEVTIDDGGIIRSLTDSGANAVAVPLTNWVMLTADYTLNNVGTEQKLFNTTTNGTLTLPTGVYEFDYWLYLLTMSATSGNAAIDPIGAGTAVTDRWGQHIVGIDNSAALSAGTQTGSGAVTQQSVASAVSAGTGQGMMTRGSGMFRISTGGTIIPSITLVTAAAATLKAGSWFRISKVGESSETYVGNWS